MINLNNTTPAAPNGGTNVLFQNDASGNVSAYTAIVKQTVTPASGVVAINAALGNSVFITVNQAVTSVTFTNLVDGQEITLLWAQDATGHTVTLPTTGTLMLGSLTVTATANKHTCQKYTYNQADNNLYAIGVNNM